MEAGDSQQDQTDNAFLDQDSKDQSSAAQKRLHQILDRNLDDEPVQIDLNVQVVNADNFDDSDKDLDIILKETYMSADTPPMLNSKVESQKHSF